MKTEPTNASVPAVGAHTPGLWRTNDAIDAVESVATGETIATMFDWQSDAERIANARLIAAAPELLTALNAWTEWAVNRDIPFALISHTRAAIAKATAP